MRTATERPHQDEENPSESGCATTLVLVVCLLHGPATFVAGLGRRSTMRYQVSCPVAIGASSWSISDELGQSPFRVDCRSWNGGDAIGILDGRSVMAAEARLH